MAHTYTNLLYHTVFSTKDRQSLITHDQKAEMHAYIAGLVKEKGGKVLAINSMQEHVHILVAMRPDVAISELMKFVKANSSRWMKQRFRKPFAWQKGFGAFSVSRSGASAVAKYIRDQEIHHRKMDYRNEFVTFLDKNEVDFDEEFLWK